MQNKINGWNEQDYLLWCEIQQLPSYGLLTHGDRMISLKEIIHAMEHQANKRFDKTRKDKKREKS